MKKKKGFISISIIYSFFIIFLLLLTLIMTTYINNRYSFSIFSKDEKRSHATNTTVTPNLTSAIEYDENFYSYYYYRTKDIQTTINNSDGSTSTITTTENYDYTNFYYYNSTYNSTSKLSSLDNQTIKFVIILGPYKDHFLNYTNFFGKSGSEAAFAYKGIKAEGASTSGKIIIAPSINSEYVTWTEALKTKEGRTDLNTNLINAVGSQITNTESTADFITQCRDASNCQIKITYIGIQDGANGLLKYIGNIANDTVSDTDTRNRLAYNNITTERYYVIDSTTICNSTKCDELEDVEKTNIKTNLQSTSGTYARFFASTVNANETETDKYYKKMSDLYGVTTSSTATSSTVLFTSFALPNSSQISSYELTKTCSGTTCTINYENTYKLIGQLITNSI